MNRINMVFVPNHFAHFIKCLLSNPKHFEHRTMHTHFSIKSDISAEDLQKEIYDWLAKRVDKLVSDLTWPPTTSPWGDGS